MSKELPINSILGGRYRIDRVIGCGGFGITYYATHISLGKACAIKEFFISGKCNRQSDGLHVVFENMPKEAFSHYKTRFLQEAQTLTRIDNPHVVHVSDVFEENGTAYIVMGFIQGITLQQKISQSGALPYEEAVNYIAQLSEAVGACHNQHILHRDIKPDNVMITPENMAILIDFGSARTFVNNAIQDHTAILTMGYAPIEQYTSGTKKGNYTDIYALGGVFYFALTGQKPIDAAERVINDQLVPPQELNPSVPDSANYTIMKALNLQPEERYQTIAEFQDDLVNWRQEGETQGGILGNNSDGEGTVGDDRHGIGAAKKKSPKWPWMVLVGVILLTVFVFFYVVNSYIYITDTEVEVDCDGGQQTISVSSNRNWSISQYGAGWVHEHRQGDYLIVDVDENTTYEPRETTIRVKCLNDSHYTTIKQAAAPRFSISSTSVSFPSLGGSRRLTITTNESWRVSVGTCSWGHLTKNGNTLTLRVDANRVESQRTDYFEIQSLSGTTIRVNISQAAAPRFSISSTSVSFPKSGGSYQFTITSDESWHICTDTYDWGHLMRSGNILTLSVDANNSGASRTDYFVIKNQSENTLRVNISQSNVSRFSISPTSLDASCSSSTYYFTVTSDESWSISTDTYSWGHLTKNGNTLTLRLDYNPGAVREDHFIIKNQSGRTLRVNIKQH